MMSMDTVSGSGVAPAPFAHVNVWARESGLFALLARFTDGCSHVLPSERASSNSERRLPLRGWSGCESLGWVVVGASPAAREAAARKLARRPLHAVASAQDAARPSTSEHGAEPDAWGRRDARRPEGPSTERWGHLASKRQVTF